MPDNWYMLDLTCISLLTDTCRITASVIWIVFFFFAATVIWTVFCSYCYLTSFLLLLCSAQGSPALVQETPGRGRKRTGSKRTVQLPSSLLLPCPQHCGPHSHSLLGVLCLPRPHHCCPRSHSVLGVLCLPLPRPHHCCPRSQSVLGVHWEQKFVVSLTVLTWTQMCALPCPNGTELCSLPHLNRAEMCSLPCQV